MRLRAVRLNEWRVGFALLLTCSICMVGYGQEADPFDGSPLDGRSSENPFDSDDPFGNGADDPFTGANNPFGEDGDDPFAGAHQEQGGDQRRQAEGVPKAGNTAINNPTKYIKQQREATQQKQLRALAKLESPTSFEFFDTPLEEVVEFLSDVEHLDIVIDDAALDGLGLERSLPITATFDDHSLRVGLKHILRENDLAYVVEDGIVIITTEEEVAEHLTTQVYPVRELLHKAQPRESLRELMEVVVASVEPDTWEKTGGPGAIMPYQGMLVINQTSTVHQKVGKLLDELNDKVQAAGGPTMEVEPKKPRSGGFGGGGFGRREPHRQGTK